MNDIALNMVVAGIMGVFFIIGLLFLLYDLRKLNTSCEWLSEHNHREFMRAIKSSNSLSLVAEENKTLKKQNKDMKSCCNCQDVITCWKLGESRKA